MTDSSIPKCPICLDAVACARVASCGHIYCAGCFHDLLSRSYECAMCRRRMSARAYPCWELDERASAAEGHAARAAASLAAALAIETSPFRRELVRVQLEDPDPAVRCAGLLTLNEALARAPDAATVAGMHDVLSRAMELGDTAEEMELAWRAVARCAASCPDAPRLLRMGAHGYAVGALLSAVAGDAARRAVTSAVSSLCVSDWRPFAFFLERPVAHRLAARAPTALARVALFVPDGVDALIQHRLLAGVLPPVVATGHPVATELVDAVSAHPHRGAAAASCVRLMAAEPHRALGVYTHALRTLAASDSQLAGALAEGGALLAAVRLAASGSCDDGRCGAAIELAHAALYGGGVAEVAAAPMFLRMAAASPHLRPRAMDLLAGCAKQSEAFARAVIRAGGLAEGLDDDVFFLAGEAFSHPRVAEDHPAELAAVLRRARYESYAHIFCALSAAETRAGAAAVVPEMCNVVAMLGHDSEVVTETARAVLLNCAVDHRPAVMRALRAVRHNRAPRR